MARMFAQTEVPDNDVGGTVTTAGAKDARATAKSNATAWARVRRGWCDMQGWYLCRAVIVRRETSGPPGIHRLLWSGVLWGTTRRKNETRRTGSASRGGVGGSVCIVRPMAMPMGSMAHAPMWAGLHGHVLISIAFGPLVLEVELYGPEAISKLSADACWAHLQRRGRGGRLFKGRLDALSPFH